MIVSAFSDAELNALLTEWRLGRLATVGKDGTPHDAPVGWLLNAAFDAIEISGRDFARSGLNAGPAGSSFSYMPG